LSGTLDETAGLITPAAVRIVDLDAPLADLAPSSERLDAPYRSLLAVARLDGEPLGAVSVALDHDGRTSRERLAGVIRRELGPELRDALEHRGLDLPDSLPAEGIAWTPRRNGRRVKRLSVSVVVTTCHASSRLARCLRSVLACEYPDFEVIVVESCPRSRATARLLGEQFEAGARLRYVEEARLGLSRARNAGLAHATGDVVMFTDDDVVVDPQWIHRGVAALVRDGVECVTGLVLPLELETEAQLRFERCAQVGNGFRRQVFSLPARQGTHPFFYYRLGAIGTGANTTLRADVARELGGFDKTLGAGTPALGGEDLDLYVRLLRAGGAVSYDPSVVVWHEHPDGAPRVRRYPLSRGTALGAAVAKQLVVGPQRAELLRALPTGVRYELDGAVRLGLALGPPAYAASALGGACEPRRRWRRWCAEIAVPSPRDRVLVAAAAAACLLAPALVVASAPGPLRLAAVLALLCLAPGTALLLVLGMRTRIEPGLAVGASLGVATVLAQSMLWVGAWWPEAASYLVAAACLPVLIAALRGRPPPDAEDAVGTWVTEIELAAPLSDVRAPPGPRGVRGKRARVLVRLHRQPIGFVELALERGTLAARDVRAAVDERLSSALAAHLARDGLSPAALTTEGLSDATSPPCEAAGFYGETEPFVSVIVTADGHDGTSLGRLLRSMLAVDYPSFEIVVARAGVTAANLARPALVHPKVRYVAEPSRDASAARRQAVAAACGDVLAFAEGNVVVDSMWLRALVRGLTPACRVGCVTGSVVSDNGDAAAAGASFVASRQALISVDAIDTARMGDALIPRFLEAGWTVSHEPAAMAWRQPEPPRAQFDVRKRAQRAVAATRRGVHAASLVRPAVAHAAVLVGAAAAWAFSLLHTDLDRMAGLGLLDALPPSYFVAFGLLLAGFMTAVSRAALPHRLLWVYAAALIVVLHGTTPLLYDEPRYTWTYTHLGVIALIAQTGAVDRTIDIYNNWPGFFALVAWASSAAALSAASFAAWAQVFFNLAYVAGLQFALRGVTRDERLIWTASLLFLLGNWLGQDYLAPQSLAFALSLVILGLCLRCGPGSDPARPSAARSWTRALDRFRAQALRGARVDEPGSTAPLSWRAALVVGGICYLAVVVSHQLTPIIALIGVTGLAVIARRVPLWVPLAMAVMEVWWLTLAWPYVSERFTLFDPAPSASQKPPGYEIGNGLPGLELVAYAVRVEVAIMVALAAVGLVRRRRAGYRDLAAVILVLAPLAIIGVQSYGGEARYRVYLFALPWLSFFAAAAFASPPGCTRVVAHRARLALSSAALGICLLFAYFGLELMNRVDAHDVAAARWFERHAPSGSLRVGVTTNFPSRLTARYAAVYDPSYSAAVALTERARFRGHTLGIADLPAIERTLQSYGAPHTYVTLGVSQERHARLYGLLPAGSVQSLDRALQTSPSFSLVYRQGSAAIFAYRPGDRSESAR
jgi:glycosyltransferase involved in cell wall biosynthesis